MYPVLNFVSKPLLVLICTVYLQGLKRLMTQCQKMFPTDPSHSVNYEKD